MRKHLLHLTWLFTLMVLLTALTAFGAEKKGVVTEDGQTHIYTNQGKLVKNKPAYEVKSGGKTLYYQIDKKGAAKRYKGVEALAAKQLCKLKAGGKKSEKNLKKAFKWSSSLKYQNNTKSSLKGNAAAKYYGRFGFEKNRGDCNTVAYTFYWMAKVLGYPVEAVRGYVPDGSLDNLQSHAWTTISFGSTTYVFDPDFNRVYAGKLGTYCGYKIRYGQKSTYRYFSEKKQEIK